MAKTPMRVAVTGAAGQIGYSLLFRIANGDMLGKDQPVILQLLEIADEKAQKALKGVMMEIDDCAFPLLAGMTAHSDPMTAFKDADFALLVGARPRGPGMERKDLLEANAQIFTVQGKALDAVASRNVKVLVVGNPANTNAYIAMKSAPSLPAKNFTAMLRLDHNRALSQVAAKTGKPVASIEKLCVWGNHSPTMYADYRFATIDGKSVKDIDQRRRLEPRHLPADRRQARRAPSSKRAACRRQRRQPTPRSTTCMTGTSAPPASGPRWASRRTVRTASRRTPCSASRSPSKTASTPSSRAWPSTRSRKSASTSRSRN